MAKKDKVDKVKDIKENDIISKKEENSKEKKVKEVREVKEVSNAQKEVKEERKKVFFEEVKSFLILALIILAIVFGSWYWYTHIYNNDRVSIKEEKEVKEYKTVKYTVGEGKKIDILNGKYLIEHTDNVLYKIMDLQTNVLYEGKLDCESVIEGVDSNIYVIKNEYAELENRILVYKLEDKELKEVEDLSKKGVYYTELKYQYDRNKKDYKTIGFVGTRISYDENMNEMFKTYIYTLGGEEYELDDYFLVGDEARSNAEDSIVTYDENNIIIGIIENNKQVMGLYNVDNKKIVIKPQYDGLYTDKDDNYIALKGEKAGIINNKLKKILNFEYDFIDRNDGYYVVAKNGKMAIMNDNYKLVTKYVFDYQRTNLDIGYTYNLLSRSFNTFSSVKMMDKYILSINSAEIKYGLDYNKHETYVINSDGTYDTFKANMFVAMEESNLIYSYDTASNKFTLYDKDFKEKYTIDVNAYDYEDIPALKLINENTLVLILDSNVYFDYETGEEIEGIKEYSAVVNGVTINYNSSKKQVSYMIENKKVADVNVEGFDNLKTYFTKIDDNSFYFATPKEFVYINKGE